MRGRRGKNTADEYGVKVNETVPNTPDESSMPLEEGALSAPVSGGGRLENTQAGGA